MPFDRAQFLEGAPAFACAACRRVPGARYWELAGAPVCEACHDAMLAEQTEVQTWRRFVSVALHATPFALVLGAAYAVFVAVTDMQIALLSIGIAYLIARSVVRSTRGVGGRRYRLLAVGLTYAAVCLGYVPALVGALRERPAASAPSGASDARQPPAAQAEPRPTAPSRPPRWWALPAFVALLFVLSLAAPVALAVFSGDVLGAIIVGVALYEAWKWTRPLLREWLGPLRTDAPAPEVAGP